jgi:hypothetical protein
MLVVTRIRLFCRRISVIIRKSVFNYGRMHGLAEEIAETRERHDRPNDHHFEIRYEFFAAIAVTQLSDTVANL